MTMAFFWGEAGNPGKQNVKDRDTGNIDAAAP
jgi:hypothetical protein